MNNIKLYPCVESTAMWKFGNLTIRIWRDEPKKSIQDRYDNSDTGTALANMFVGSSDIPPSILAEFIAGLSRINAVQVIENDTLDGIMIYTVPF